MMTTYRCALRSHPAESIIRWWVGRSSVPCGGRRCLRFSAKLGFSTSTTTTTSPRSSPRQRSKSRIRRLGSARSEEHTSELQSQSNLVCRLLLEKKKKTGNVHISHPPTVTFLRG